MQEKTQQLIEKLATMNTTLARVWNADCATAITDDTVYCGLNGRQQSQVDQIRQIDAAFAVGKVPSNELYVISDGAFKTF